MVSWFVCCVRGVVCAVGHDECGMYILAWCKVHGVHVCFCDVCVVRVVYCECVVR